MKTKLLIIPLVLAGLLVYSTALADTYSRSPNGSTPDVPVTITFSISPGANSINVIFWDSTKAKYFYDKYQTCYTGGAPFSGTAILDLTSVDINGNGTHPAYGDTIERAEWWGSTAGDCSSHFNDVDFSGGDTYTLTQGTPPPATSTIATATTTAIRLGFSASDIINNFMYDFFYAFLIVLVPGFIWETASRLWKGRKGAPKPGVK